LFFKKKNPGPPPKSKNGNPRHGPVPREKIWGGEAPPLPLECGGEKKKKKKGLSTGEGKNNVGFVNKKSLFYYCPHTTKWV